MSKQESKLSVDFWDLVYDRVMLHTSTEESLCHSAKTHKKIRLSLACAVCVLDFSTRSNSRGPACGSKVEKYLQEWGLCARHKLVEIGCSQRKSKSFVNSGITCVWPKSVL